MMIHMTVLDWVFSQFTVSIHVLLLPSVGAPVLIRIWEEDSVSAAVASWLLCTISVAIVKGTCPTGIESKNTCKWTPVTTLSLASVTSKKPWKWKYVDKKKYSNSHIVQQLFSCSLILNNEEMEESRGKKSRSTVVLLASDFLACIWISVFSKVLRFLTGSGFTMSWESPFFLWLGWKAKLSGVVK